MEVERRKLSTWILAKLFRVSIHFYITGGEFSGYVILRYSRSNRRREHHLALRLQVARQIRDRAQWLSLPYKMNSVEKHLNPELQLGVLFAVDSVITLCSSSSYTRSLSQHVTFCKPLAPPKFFR